MTEKQQLELQAYLDGELPAGKARELADWLARDAEARALAAELQNTRHALAGFESEMRLAESREFYWSKIAREIERAEQGKGSADPAAQWRWVWRILAPAGACALVACAGLLAVARFRAQGARGPEAVEVALADSNPFTYHDYSSGTTLVWFSYSGETNLADADTDDTLD